MSGNEITLYLTLYDVGLSLGIRSLYELEKAENVRLFSTLNVNIMCVPYKLHLQIPIGNFDIPKLGTELACHPDSVNLHAAHVPSVYTTP